MNQSIRFRHAVFSGDQQIDIRQSAMPESVPGEVLVRVARTALCGSDNRLWRSGATQIPGHEIFGTVEQPGHRQHGQRVCIYIPLHCGHCASCQAGLTQSCETQSSLIGWNRDGGFGEYVRVPQQCLLSVPGTITDALAPLLLDTIGTSAHAVRTVSRLSALAPQREPVLVYGAGPIGIGVLIALLDSGYRDIYMADPSAARLRFACDVGAAPYNPDQPTRYPAIFECSGAHAARDDAIARVAPGGAIVLIGENSAPWAIQEGPVFRRKDFMLLRSFYFPKSEHRQNIELLLRQRTRYEKMIGTDIALDQLADAYPEFVAGNTLKPQLAFE